MTLTLETTPTDATHWSTRDLVGRVAVRGLANRAHLQPTASSRRNVPALQRFSLHREGARHLTFPQDLGESPERGQSRSFGRDSILWVKKS